MKKALIGCYVLAGAALAAACGSFDYGDEKPTEILVDAENPNWTADIQYLMELKCMNCHADPLPKFSPRDTIPIKLDDEKIFKAQAARIKARVFNSPADPMPPNFGTPLSDNEKKALMKYLDAVIAAQPEPSPGAGGDGGGGDGTALSQAFVSNCSLCHKADGSGMSGPKLRGYAKGQAAFETIVRMGGSGGMPPFSDKSAYSDADLKNDHDYFKANP